MEKIKKNFIFNILIFMILVYLNKRGVLGKEKNYNVGNHDSFVMCSISGWANTYHESNIIDVSRIDPYLCTHLIYSFAGIDALSSRITSLDINRDLGLEDGGKEGGFQKITNLKTKFPHLKVMVAIGGWHEGSVKYSAMASSAQKKKSFIESVTQFLRDYNFDGVDMAWLFPTDRGGKPEDKRHFTQLLKDLKSVFVKNKWVLTTSLSKSTYLIHKAYEVEEISDIVDYMNILTFDYHGPWEKKTGCNAPLYPRDDGYDKENNIDSTIQLYIELGAKRKKLILGVPFYGWSFILDDPSNTSVGVKAESGPDEGYTKYSKICEINFSNWTTKRDKVQRVVYAFNKEKWISYDDELSIKEKVEYAVSNRLGGIFAFQVEQDDVGGKCKKKTVPLLRAINEVFAEDFEKSSSLSPRRLPHYIPNQQHKSNGAWALIHTRANWIIIILLLPFLFF